MIEKLAVLQCAVATAADAAEVGSWFLPTGVGFTILGVSFDELSHNGTVTTATVDVQDDGSDVTGATALDVTTIAGEYAAADNSYNLHIGGGSEINLDLNIVGGGDVTGVFCLWGFYDY